MEFENSLGGTEFLGGTVRLNVVGIASILSRYTAAVWVLQLSIGMGSNV